MISKELTYYLITREDFHGTSKKSTHGWIEWITNEIITRDIISCIVIGFCPSFCQLDLVIDKMEKLYWCPNWVNAVDSLILESTHITYWYSDWIMHHPNLNNHYDSLTTNYWSKPLSPLIYLIMCKNNQKVYNNGLNKYNNYYFLFRNNN